MIEENLVVAQETALMLSVKEGKMENILSLVLLVDTDLDAQNTVWKYLSNVLWKNCCIAGQLCVNLEHSFSTKQQSDSDTQRCRSQIGFTALMFAVHNWDIQCVQILLEAGADKDIKARVRASIGADIPLYL